MPSRRQPPTRLEKRRGPESSFWAVTAYFNPAGWKARKRNYEIFRRHLGLPLLTVELAFDGHAELTSADADLYLRLEDGDVMWQKERLLNVGVAALPGHVKHVAWLDGDLVFERADLWRDVVAELRHNAVLQPFERVVSLGPGAAFARQSGAVSGVLEPVFDREIAVARWLAAHSSRHRPGARFPSRRDRSGEDEIATTGVAWAARRETVERMGLFDTAIVGSADAAMLAGFLGEAEPYLRGRRDYRRRCLGIDYERWAEVAFDTVRGRVGAVPGRVIHLWHGSLDARAYDGRHRILDEHDFNPVRDLRIGADGAWVWATDKAGLHRGIEEYFRSRREDDGGELMPTARQDEERASRSF